MTEQERNEINPELCAEGLRYILHNYNFQLDFAEKAALVGAIMLLRDKNDNWYLQHADEGWKKKIP